MDIIVPALVGLVLILVAVLIVVITVYNNAAGHCTCGAFTSPVSLIDRTPHKPRYAERWGRRDLVKFSRRYETLRDNEV